jgi:Holliday junction resolvase RusA-like endonuclease
MALYWSTGRVTPRTIASYVVEGIPRPKGSRVAGVTRDGRRFNRESNPRASEWLKMAREDLRSQHAGEPLKPPYRITATFFFPEPKKPSHPFPSRGDLDKYSRNLLDACEQGGILTNDSAVIELSAVKRWGEPRTELTVEEVEGY